MKLTQDELIDVCSEVTTMLGAILARHVELNESLIGNEATDTAKKKLESLRQQTADAKAELQKLWYAQRRKRELEKIRDDHAREREEQTEGKATQRTIQLLDGHGRLIGRLRIEPNGDVTVYDSRGKLVSRELKNLTFDRSGRFRGRGKQGLVVLGQTLR